jgi:hypothetical protein
MFRKCERCGKKYQPTGRRQLYDEKCRKIVEKEYQKNYQENYKRPNRDALTSGQPPLKANLNSNSLFFT